MLNFYWPDPGISEAVPEKEDLEKFMSRKCLFGYFYIVFHSQQCATF